MNEKETGVWGGGEDRKGPCRVYRNYLPGGTITVIIPEIDGEEDLPTEYGECPGCNTTIRSNMKYIYCPYCGKPVGCT